MYGRFPPGSCQTPQSPFARHSEVTSARSGSEEPIPTRMCQLAVGRRSKVVPLMGIQYRLARWPYGTKGLKRLRAGTAGRGTWRTIVNIC
jgi:hypothetical protein